MDAVVTVLVNEEFSDKTVEFFDSIFDYTLQRIPAVIGAWGAIANPHNSTEESAEVSANPNPSTLLCGVNLFMTTDDDIKGIYEQVEKDFMKHIHPSFQHYTSLISGVVCKAM